MDENGSISHSTCSTITDCLPARWFQPILKQPRQLPQQPHVWCLEDQESSNIPGLYSIFRYIQYLHVFANHEREHRYTNPQLKVIYRYNFFRFESQGVGTRVIPMSQREDVSINRNFSHHRLRSLLFFTTCCRHHRILS